jgi:hypothetical protein
VIKSRCYIADILILKKEGIVMNRWTGFILAIILLTVTPATIFAWGAITHAYFADELGVRWGNRNIQEIYGATLPDVFNLMYGSPYQEYLWTQTHYEFGEFADQAVDRPTDASAYGFICHNDAWGADYTAHYNAVTDPGDGYVITKANSIVPALVPQLTDVLTAAGVPDALTVAQRLAPGLGENFIETAVDVLVRRNESPSAGLRLFIAAYLRDIRVPFMLIGAYARDFAQEFGISRFMAILTLLAAECEYRDLMILYGGLFMKSEDEIIQLLAEQGVVLAQTLLKAETGLDVVVPAAPLEAFLRDVAIPAVESDYSAEIAATLAYLESAMDAHGFTVSTEITTAAAGSNIDGKKTIELNQNHPNPFNPSTAVSFYLSEESHVKLSVYDANGRLVNELMNARLSEGFQQTVWNGTDSRGNPVSTGVYFCRLQAGSKVLTKKMVLIK